MHTNTTSRPDPDGSGITHLFRRAAAEGRDSLFEHEVYGLLASAGIAAPSKYELIPRATVPADGVQASFPGARLVAKIVSRTVVHKTDVDGVKVVPNQAAAIRTACTRMLEQLPGKYQDRLERNLEPLPAGYRGLAGNQLRDAIDRDIQGVLLVEYIQPDSGDAGTELLVGIRNTRDFGMIITAGIGGTDAELLARVARRDQAAVSAATALTSAGEFLELFKPTLAYRQLAGLARGRARLLTDEKLVACFAAFIDLANRHSPCKPDAAFVIEELEVNPLTCVAGSLVALDGLCRFGQPRAVRAPRPLGKIDKLLHPVSIGMVGVSSTKVNFGRIILNNILAAGYDKSRLVLIKPDGQELDGVRCVASLAALDRKLDLLILAVTADAAFGLVDAVIEADAAESVMLIPGGMGETEASREPAGRMMARIDAAHRQPGGGPVFLGGNCLGVVSHAGHYDSWFIPEERLPKPRKKARRNSALISQSGAFMITRLSKNPWFDPAYMVAVGNQNDITHSDMINCLAANHDIDVIGMYAEGFNDLDGLALAVATRKAVAGGKQVVIYKAGQSPAGQRAALGHTASIAGDYDICQSVLTQAGAMVARDVSEFSDLFYIADCLHDKVIGGNRLGAVSGAGFETVAMADSIHTDECSMTLAVLQASTREQLAGILAARKLDAIMEVRNPFDINPGADDELHLLCTAAIAADPGVDAVVVGLDPLSPMMRALPHSARAGFDIDSAASIASTLPGLVASCDKPVIGIVDGGPLYDPLAAKLMDQGVCIFRSCERGVRALVRYTEARLQADKWRKPGLPAGP